MPKHLNTLEIGIAFTTVAALVIAGVRSSVNNVPVGSEGSPIIDAYGRVVQENYQAEWGGLTPEQAQLHEDCLAGARPVIECRFVEKK